MEVGQVLLEAAAKLEEVATLFCPTPVATEGVQESTGNVQSAEAPGSVPLPVNVGLKAFGTLCHVAGLLRGLASAMDDM